MSLRSSLTRLERLVGGIPSPPPPPPSGPAPGSPEWVWDRIELEEIPRMSSEERYWLYKWCCWRLRNQPPGYDPPVWVNEFLTGLGLRPFDLGGVVTVAGQMPGEEYPAAV